MAEAGRRAGGAVLVKKREGGRGDLRRIDSEPFREAPDEDRLSASEVSDQEDDVSRPEARREFPREGPRLRLRGTEPLFHQKRGRASRRTPKAAPSVATTSLATSASSPRLSTARSPAAP